MGLFWMVFFAECLLFIFCQKSVLKKINQLQLDPNCKLQTDPAPGRMVQEDRELQLF